MERPLHQLITDAERFAAAQENMAARSKEDSEHWHHVALANLLREMASALTAAR